MMYDQTRAQQPADRTRGPDGLPPRTASLARGTPTAPGSEPLLPSADRDEIVLRLRHVLNTFADTPREALEEAESAYDETTAQLVTALAERRRLLRAGWEEQDPGTRSDELRNALRQYREVIQRLLQL
ncbi:hypothetical protein [Streptomyces sp. NPDC020951]|uniref:hypothetical protein n=1 Tax=Streptomyces sp. NPDC020951 TaxID=3365104 RepID=UPI0037B27C51